MKTRNALVSAPIVALCLTFFACGGKSESPAPAPKPSATKTIITLGFDDGWLDQYQNARSILVSHGMHATFFINSGSPGGVHYMTWPQVTDLALDGNEIGGHTVDHLDLTSLSAEEQQHQIADDRKALISHGFQPVSLAYPYGLFNDTSKWIAAGCGYTCARGISGGQEAEQPTDAFATKAYPSVQITTTLAEMQSWVTEAEKTGGWVQIIFHHVTDASPAPDEFTILPANLSAFLDWLQPRAANGTVVRTTKEALSSRLYTVTASADAGGVIAPNGTVSVVQGSSRLFTITASGGNAISSVTVDGVDMGAISTYTFPATTTGSHTISASFAASEEVNIAPDGTGYVWSQNTSATSDGNRAAKPGLNDGDLATNVTWASGEEAGGWECAGVVFSAAKTVSRVDFINGDVDGGGNGWLEANIGLQFSTDGTAWTDSGWTISPTYSYLSDACGQTYSFTGAAAQSNVMGARIVGQVRVADNSWKWVVKEVRVYGN